MDGFPGCVSISNDEDGDSMKGKICPVISTVQVVGPLAFNGMVQPGRAIDQSVLASKDPASRLLQAGGGTQVYVLSGNFAFHTENDDPNKPVFKSEPLAVDCLGDSCSWWCGVHQKCSQVCRCGGGS